MCFLCDNSPLNALDGTHDHFTNAPTEQPVEAAEPDGVIDYGSAATANFSTGAASDDQNINGLLSGTAWADAELTYSFPDSIDDYNYGASWHTSVSEFDANQKAYTEYWLDLADQVSGLTFTELTGADGELNGASEAELKFLNSNDPGTAYAYYPSTGSWGGDSFYGPSGDNPNFGNYDFSVIGHEIGHALGLSHGHTSSGGFGVMDADRDSHEFSIMTYRTYIDSPGTFYSASSDSGAQTYMMYDIAAIQYLYGADFETEATDTVYTFDANTGEMFVNGVGNGYSSGKIFRTIWDGNGEDTYDFSNYTNDLNIDLAPGSWVDLDVGGNDQRARLGGGSAEATGYANHARAHVFNALQYEDDVRSLIENANGGSGDDVLSGNAADNILNGGGGADTMSGGAGDDTFIGGSGADEVTYGGAFGAYVIGVIGEFVTVVGEGLDTIYDDVETILFSDGSYSFAELFEIGEGDDEEPDPEPEPNIDPTANDDALTTSESSALSANLFADNGAGVDSDSDGGTLSLVSINGDADGVVTLASGATVSFSANGDISYDPSGQFEDLNAGETATDSFTYIVSDGQGGSAEATVTVTITGEDPPNSAPDARNDALSVGEGADLTANLFADNGSGADSDPDGDALTLTSINGETDGSVTLASGAVVTFSSNGQISYDQHGQFEDLNEGETATDTFTYAVSDGEGGSDEATVTVTITGEDPPNSAPVARNDALSVNEGADLTANVFADNGSGADSDSDGDALTLTSINGETDGSVTLASGAVVTFSSNGQITYDQNGQFEGLSADETATDTFTYIVSDGEGGSAEATVTVTITGEDPPNSSPIARNDALSVDEGADLTANLFADNGSGADDDPNGDALTLTSINGETDGSVTLASGAVVTFSSNGQITYDQNGAFSDLLDGQQATDSFSYQVSDGNGGFDSATVTITVNGEGQLNGAPVARDDAVTTGEAAATSINVFADNGAGADFDPNGDALILISVAGETDGSATLSSGAVVTFSANGDLTYDPNGAFDDLLTGQSETDSFTYIVSDGQGGFDEATVVVTIEGAGQPNQGPTARDDVFSTDEATAISGNLFADNGAGADSDPDGDSLILTSINGETDGSVTLGSGAVVTFASNGDISFDPNGAYDGLFSGDQAEETLTYTVSDGQGGSATGSVTITIDGLGELNNGPSAQNDALSGGEDDLIAGNLFADNGSGADSDANGDALILTSIAGQSGGAATLGSGATVTFSSNGAITYDSNGVFDGLTSGETATDSFVYTISDGRGGSDQATVTVTIIGEDEGPSVIFGTDRADELIGTTGDDEIHGLRGRDVIMGMGGDDTIFGNAGADRIVTGGGADEIDAGVGRDSVLGGAGADIIGGGAGRDTLKGGIGADTLIAGRGSDQMRGGDGQDTFVFGARDGRGNKIFDFNTSGDKLDFSRTGLSFDDITISSVGRGQDAMIRTKIGTHVRLENVTADELNQGDFIF